MHARGVEAVVRVLRLGEGGVAVLLREQAGVVVGDLDGLVFEEGVAEGEEVLDLGGFGGFVSVEWIRVDKEGGRGEQRARDGRED